MKYIFRRMLLIRMAVPTERDPALSALTVTTMAVVLNVICAVFVIAVTWDLRGLISGSFSATAAWLAPLILVTAAVQYRLWIAGGRYQAIAREPVNETPRQHRLRTVLMVLYLVASALAIPTVGVLMHHIGSN